MADEDAPVLVADNPGILDFLDEDALLVDVVHDLDNPDHHSLGLAQEVVVLVVVLDVVLVLDELVLEGVALVQELGVDLELVNFRRRHFQDLESVVDDQPNPVMTPELRPQ